MLSQPATEAMAYDLPRRLPRRPEPTSTSLGDRQVSIQPRSPQFASAPVQAEPVDPLADMSGVELGAFLVMSAAIGLLVGALLRQVLGPRKGSR